MRVDRIQTTNLRNLASAAVEFGPALNVLVGENGQGKTNLLEAIHYFRFGRSFRAQSDAELIQFDQPFCRFEAAVTFADGRAESFACGIERRGNPGQVARTIKVAGQALRRRSDLAGRFPVVLFGPHDLRVVSGEPEHRRRFFDMVGTTTDPGYLRAANEYRRTLDQRNAALKARAGRDEMEAWNDRLVGPGAELTLHRRNLAERLAGLMRIEAGVIDSPFEFSMHYESSLLEDGNADGETIQAHFRERLVSLAGEEMRRGVTLVGPHRDDVEFRLGGHDLRRYGSQGQRRLFAVLLKRAELVHLEGELHEPCVLLLDDVFSEFDASLVERLQHVFDGERQVFVTTPVDLPPRAVGRTRTLRVSNGVVAPC
ncbi:MAG TPA: DNA replication/repair protein RecF [Candidatus Krumholzibacteria bacterium]|nr:DNA replication/repair protein RecF [Candidatus Krumholzibacteria bacterium]